ncbi:MAG: VWA domain-containing protein [Bryobacterales bacterium]|nr:VWA domain-containing protein [Bryobacteraceae bacterium]MDW8355490.1 VWA domain-containing protein [Bryobacterales bacterium]
MFRAFLLAALLLEPSAGTTRLLVTVIEKKSGLPVKDLKREEFAVFDDGKPRRVETVEFSSSLIDVMLLLDTSLLGEMVQPVADNLIAQLQPKEQMAIVAFHSAADLVQDFTSSQDLLRRALGAVKYGNPPRLLDALYASIDGGFRHSSFRRVIILLTTGVEGDSRVTERQVLDLARRNGVSIYPVYVLGQERGLFERLAQHTGGAPFNLRDMQRASKDPPGPRIFEVLRSHYTLTLEGNLALGERVRIQIKRPERLLVSGLPLD